MSKFKIGLSLIFGLFILIGIIVFAASKGTSSGGISTVTVWGYLPSNTFEQFLGQTALNGSKTVSVVYVQKNPATFESDFVNALANGSGPDVVMLSENQLLQNENRLFVIPFANYPERTYLDSFVQEGELFLAPTGIAAVPFMMDPLVLYWNRDLFNAANISIPPMYWDQVITDVPKLSLTDRAGNVTQSAIGLGEWNNVDNAKSIISALLLQAGTPIVTNQNGLFSSALTQGKTSSNIQSPAVAALNFYTQFSNPQSQTYSWNRSLTDSLTSFLAGNTAMYVGFASELPSIRAKNPNLNFDVTALPQPRQLKTPVDFGHLYGLAIVKQSKNVSAAFTVITTLTSTDSLGKLVPFTNLPPVSRSLLATAPADPYLAVFYKDALISASWLDPDPQSTDRIFELMVQSITSGQAETSSAVEIADEQLGALLPR